MSYVYGQSNYYGCSEILYDLRWRPTTRELKPWVVLYTVCQVLLLGIVIELRIILSLKCFSRLRGKVNHAVPKAARPVLFHLANIFSFPLDMIYLTNWPKRLFSRWLGLRIHFGLFDYSCIQIILLSGLWYTIEIFRALNWICGGLPFVAKMLYLDQNPESNVQYRPSQVEAPRQSQAQSESESQTEERKVETDSEVVDEYAASASCSFTILVVCVLWYAFIYGATETINPSWTNIFGWC